MQHWTKNYIDQIKNQKFAPLERAETAKLLQEVGNPSSVQFVIEQFEQINIVPIFKNNQIITYRKEKVY